MAEPEFVRTQGMECNLLKTQGLICMVLRFNLIYELYLYEKTGAPSSWTWGPGA
jgi:hypothetical protein